MSGRGRGRGAFMEETLDVAPRRPGMSGRGMSAPVPPQVDESVLIKLFRGRVTEKEAFNCFHDFFKNSKIDDIEDRSTRCINFLGQHVMEDSSNAHLIAKNIFVMGTNPTVGSQLKKKAFSKLQDLYLGLSDIKLKQGVTAYRNVIYFIISMAHFCRPITISPIDDIVAGLMSIAEDLCSNSTEEDMKILAVIVIRCSSYLTMKDPGGKAVRTYLTTSLHPLVNKVRTKICSQTLSQTAKAWLLLSVELMYSQFDGLNEESKKFYLKELGNAIVIFEQETEKMFIRGTEGTHYLTNEIKNEITYF